MTRLPPRFLIILVAAGFTALAVLFALALERPDPDQLPSAFVGRKTPSLTIEHLRTVDSPITTKDDLESDRIKLVNFWASWCAPCRAEHPNLEKLARAGIPVHGINYKDKPEHAAQFLAELGNPFATLAADPKGRTGLDWGIYGVPETFVIDANGEIILRHAGPITSRILESRILPSLGDNASAGVSGR